MLSTINFSRHWYSRTTQKFHYYPPFFPISWSIIIGVAYYCVYVHVHIQVCYTCSKSNSLNFAVIINFSPPPPPPPSLSTVLGELCPPSVPRLHVPVASGGDTLQPAHGVGLLSGGSQPGAVLSHVYSPQVRECMRQNIAVHWLQGYAHTSRRWLY